MQERRAEGLTVIVGNKYLLGPLLGQGSFGEVYKGINKET